jgi:hypothetical protein
MLLPSDILDRLGLCAHLELIVFLATIFSTSVVLRRALPGSSPSLTAWVGFFLFPGFLVYDSNVSTGADHIAALWAPAGLLALFMALRTLAARDFALVGVFAAAAALTKYSAICLALPLLLAAGIACLIHIGRRRHVKRAFAAGLALVATFVALWSPHWLKNALWYGDPLYPTLHRVLPVRPWDAEAATYFERFTKGELLRPTHDLAGMLESVRVALTLGFEVNEYGFHGTIPTFGFLFAATLYCLPFVRTHRRIWLVYALGIAAAIVWYWTNHRDRYLQAVLPWLVVGTLAVLISAWRSGAAGKLAAALLVTTQIAVGAGVFFIPSNAMITERHPLPHVLSIIGSGYTDNRAKRFLPYENWSFASWVAMGKRMPEGARVLIHEDRLWLGLNAPVLVDEASWQAGIRYSKFRSRRELFDRLQRERVTHIMTARHHPGGGEHGLLGDLAFWDFVSAECTREAQVGSLTLWKMPAKPPSPSVKTTALVLTCTVGAAGLYDYGAPAGWVKRADPIADGAAPEELVSAADLIATEGGCKHLLAPKSARAFQKVATRDQITFWRSTRTLSKPSQ